MIAGQVVGGTCDVDLVGSFGRARHVVPEVPVIRLAVVRMEPGLDRGQMPNQAEQRERRRRHRPQRQLFRCQPATLSSSVVRWNSRRSSSATRSSTGLTGGSGRSGVVYADIQATLSDPLQSVVNPWLARMFA